MILRLILTYALAFLPMQGLGGKAGIGGGGSTTSTATGFAYITSSVTGCYNNIATQTKCTNAFHQTPGAGHLLIAMAIWNSASATATFSTTGADNVTWTAIGSPRVGTGGTLTTFSGQMFCLASAAGGADTGLLTISGSVNFLAWEMAEYSYSGAISNCASADGSPSFAYSTNVASGTVAATGSITTTGSSDLIWAACMGADSNCSSPVGAGYTSRNDGAACAAASGGLTCSTTGSFNVNTGAFIADEVGAAAGTQSTTFSTGNADNTIMGIVAE